MKYVINKQKNLRIQAFLDDGITQVFSEYMSETPIYKQNVIFLTEDYYSAKKIGYDYFTQIILWNGDVPTTKIPSDFNSFNEFTAWFDDNVFYPSRGGGGDGITGLTGDVVASGSGNVPATIPQGIVPNKLLTGYVAPTDATSPSLITATDPIKTAFSKVQSNPIRYTVSNQTTMLALNTARIGDTAVQTTPNPRLEYQLSSLPASNINNWKLIGNSSGVRSVNGDVGDVVITKQSLEKVTNPLILYVDDSGNDTTGFGTQLSPYQSINKALLVSSNGAIIFVNRTNQTVDQSLVSTKENITIKGVGEKTVISINFLNFYKNVIIDGCTLNNIDYTLGSDNFFTIKNSVIKGNINITGISNNKILLDNVENYYIDATFNSSSINNNRVIVNPNCTGTSLPYIGSTDNQYWDIQDRFASYDLAGLQNTKTFNLSVYSSSIFIVYADQEDDEQKIKYSATNTRWQYEINPIRAKKIQVKPDNISVPQMTKDNTCISLPNVSTFPNYDAEGFGSDGFTITHSASSPLDHIRIYTNQSGGLKMKRYDGTVINAGDFITLLKGASITLSYQYSINVGNNYWQEVE